MKNKQLHILIYSLKDQLDTEIDNLRKELPETLDKHEPKKVLGEIEEGDFVVLDGLKRLSNKLFRYMMALQ